MQTIWIEPRTIRFTDVCLACEEAQPDGRPWATVEGRLPLDEDSGWATCADGHTLPVRRITHVARSSAAA